MYDSSYAPELARDQYEYDLVLTTETTLTRYFKDILPAGILAQCLEAWTAGYMIGVRIPLRLKYFVLIFFDFF